MNLALFNQLWVNHPGKTNPCDEAAFPNQCAIRVSVALEKSGVNTSTFDIKKYPNRIKKYPNRRCYSGFKHTPRHILAAQELANWMKSEKKIFGEVVNVDKTQLDKALKGKKGIVFIKDGWGPVDHIDVWNGSEMRGGETNYFSVGKEIWFWESK